jgi:hypothetical protein
LAQAHLLAELDLAHLLAQDRLMVVEVVTPQEVKDFLEVEEVDFLEEAQVVQLD